MESLMAETRKRAARINTFVDMIPARFYLGGEAQELLKPSGKQSRDTHDPAKSKSTSQLTAESALAAAAAQAAEKQRSASGTGQGKSRKKKGKRNASKGEGSAGMNPDSRSELRAKLQKRIEELRKDRRQKQSEADKLRAQNLAAKSDAKGAKDGKAATNKTAKPMPNLRKMAAVEEDVEAGRLNFEPNTASLPFEATINRRGTKVQNLRDNLRKEEANRRKLEAAETEDQRRDLKKDMLMSKAMQRARGEKVHDDIHRLRKAQRNLEMSKKKRKKNWEDRIESEKKQMEDKQAKRKENLQNQRSKKKKKTGHAES
eukprot:gnl/TRDRNA2_/TRDRNA2_193147_c0_seq1.p1 gnl/TRDRNA2_/TRDRNA2_193147_c0~~gnl/TRDRNA2_/TRDRNA2_193147_c0_seq1.p1  ORF type:complete len:316 (-),score=102.75 gnl/TRDRNA2_/TRDRNA2_193147_c0_seq1:83-1030(-)